MKGCLQTEDISEIDEMDKGDANIECSSIRDLIEARGGCFSLFGLVCLELQFDSFVESSHILYRSETYTARK